MIGRREFGLAGVSAAAWSAMHAVGVADDKQSHNGHDGVFMECARACSDCQRECDACAHHCGTMLSEGKKDHLETLRSCQDCADVCATAAQIVARKGLFSHGICEACADICAICAKACDKHPNDKMMARCADECRECEKACREMMKHKK